MHAKHWKRGFFTIWAGEGLSLLGSTLVQFALVWWLTQTTGSATVLPTATLVALLPGVVVGPLAGAVLVPAIMHLEENGLSQAGQLAPATVAVEADR